MAGGTLSTLIEQTGRRRTAPSRPDRRDHGAITARRTLEIADRCGKALGIVAELSETAVAAEAEDAAYATGLMAVIDVLRVLPAADRADPPRGSR